MVLLCRTGVGLVFFEAVAVAFEADDVGVVDDPVDHGRGDGQVSEDVARPGEREVGRQNHGRMLVAAGDKLEEQVSRVLIERDVAYFVDQQQAVAAEFDQFLGEFPAGVGFLEAGDPAGGRVEEDPVPGLGRLDADAHREVRFTGAGRSKQDHIFGFGEEYPGAQLRDEVPVR